ncbi:glycosyltransferase domain-containing protein [Aspergillus clavatus NRRL 1]|uniref:Uncharacterized protein n=1 Tax=Aspergillus clavatus (strain ATCC 1007 / CBS 513.65 / DSM 816 / NCTC 3887 / NRRL 1 / QM 1276 / 107) TaxID=344612 RepID=A1CL72_ASPCL|nr:uncharacterized protein ACLA_041120 [Aspergillus clavatus NRRL 1]EAW09896.1 conserved hypothetical protein [Aspergillus clavatus NRRL 1]
MARFGGLPSLADQYHSLWSTTTTFLQRASLNSRPRARPIRALILTTIACFFLYLCLSGPFRHTPVNYWLKYPSYHPFNGRPEDSPMLSNGGPAIGRSDTLPNTLRKANPSFHLVLPAGQKNAALCRTITSAMILNYPPPTLVRYGRKLPEGSSEYDYMVDRVTGIYNFLEYTSHVHDDDFVLIADGYNVFFQLPPEVLIQRFQTILRENNAKLRKKYGLATVEHPFRKGLAETLQKYSQRVLFGAGKECFPNLTADAGCVTVPPSSLPPDAYGWKTDTHPQGHLTRPRWLHPGTVIGQAADLKLIYAEVLRFVEEDRHKRGDYLALTQMYGRQEYVRELDRRESSSRFKEWFYRQIGISDAVNIADVSPRLETGHRYEYGIGVDFESRLFFNTRKSKRDIEWLRHHNISKTSSAQMQHGVPREKRLLLPAELFPGRIGNPFQQPVFSKNEQVKPPLNSTLDMLPSTKNHTWRNMPLLTNIHAASIPALIHLDEEKVVEKDGNEWPVKHTERLMRDTWWSKMWYQPWARALLRKYVRSPTGFDAAQSALLGGQDWWDLRGGKGGVWTDKGEWIDYAEVCTGFEEEVFDDELGRWGAEGGDTDEPLYNQFGKLIKGKEEQVGSS